MILNTAITAVIVFFCDYSVIMLYCIYIVMIDADRQIETDQYSYIHNSGAATAYLHPTLYKLTLLSLISFTSFSTFKV